MIIVLNKDITERQKDHIHQFLNTKHFSTNEVVGEEETVIAAVGKVSMDTREVELLDGVKQVIPVSRPYKLASREYKSENTVVEIDTPRGQTLRIGGQRLITIAGPAAIESREHILSAAEKLAASGAVILCGGTYIPRLSPYSFEGCGEEALKWLKEAGEKFGMPVMTEIVSENQIPVMQKYADILQIGSNNMNNYHLLKKVGELGMPVLLKRSPTATLEDFLLAAEHLLVSGTDKVILCESGIRTFGAAYNTLDLPAIPMLHNLTHLPVIADPTYCVSSGDKMEPMALASVACGADGVMVAVHSNPGKALVDGVQSMLPESFDKLVHDIKALSPVMGRSVTHLRTMPVARDAAKSSESKDKLVCAYSGKRGAYAEQAISRYFDSKNVVEKAVDSFTQIFQEVVDGTVDYGMVPIENTLGGSVFQNYDNFSRFEDVSIVGSVTLNIRHSLLANHGASPETITTVYSHPQGFSQCKKYLENTGWTLIDSVSTSTAAQTVSEQKNLTSAAICSAVNAELYGLDVIAEDIEDDPGNFTRFVIIQANHLAEKKLLTTHAMNPDTVSFIFTTKNEPGALVSVLGALSSFNMNLTRLESRPIAGKPWKYWFYADAKLPPDIAGKKRDKIDEYVQEVEQKIREITSEIRLLGVYSDSSF